ncbi:hypothetical protein C7459_103143 [Tumebacillus permanentifrigoris]|uniref:Uncharacterized protein n=1 Tax=Tumebacillus permanentifrigoris TaxID=378543 RepID=A0A316DC87_9BACL|nr:hypothetical protein C7459_103143 [Tumebacillus permanentifrigoris]
MDMSFFRGVMYGFIPAAVIWFMIAYTLVLVVSN